MRARCPRLPVGRAIPGRRVDIVSEDGKAVPEGEIGEVMVTSRGIALGYWREPELTAQSFAVNAADPSERSYRTGDLVRRGRDGLVEFVGRKDSQIKLNGYRIEPNEVEAALKACAGVTDAAVLVRRDAAGEPVALAGYVQVQAGLTADRIRAMLSERVPPYMMPAEIGILDELPWLPNFKIDRQRLAQIDAAQLSGRSHTDSSPLIGELIDELIATFEQVTRASGAKPTDNIRSLGGDSLHALELMLEISRRFRVVVPEQAQDPTPHDLAMGARHRHVAQPGRRTLDRMMPSLANSRHIPQAPNMNSLRQRTVAGLGWTGAARLLGQLLQLGATVILARLLSPKEYGLLGMVLVFTAFANNIADMGLGASIIQRSTLSDRHLNSVFWLNVVTGMALTALFALAAPLIARFYDEPQLRLLSAVIGLNFFLGSLNVVQVSLLDRALNFRAKFWIEIVSSLVSGIVALTLAFSGAGVWSLVGQTLTQTAVRVVMMWAVIVAAGAVVRFSAIRELMRFGGHLMGFGALMYWAMNVNKLVIGRWMGSAALGIYSLADKLMRFPSSTSAMSRRR